ncbi:type II toxin-antitoxin system RelE/ParE family toxin [Glaciimonas sp. GG7]
MRRYNVIFTPEAQQQLVALYRYIAVAASSEIAERYTDTIVTYCESLQYFPQCGVCHDEIRPNLRITHYKKRTIIAFSVEAEDISIIGIFYGGQDYKTALQYDLDD